MFLEQSCTSLLLRLQLLCLMMMATLHGTQGSKKVISDMILPLVPSSIHVTPVLQYKDRPFKFAPTATTGIMMGYKLMPGGPET